MTFHKPMLFGAITTVAAGRTPLSVASASRESWDPKLVA